MKITLGLWSIIFWTSLAMAREPLSFSHACDEGTTLVIAAVGDVIIHKPLIKQALVDEQRFESLWKPVEYFLNWGDLSYANLEGPVAPGLASNLKVVRDPGFVFDQSVYTTYPRFNYHPYLVEDLKKSGFDLVSTANNHAMDRGTVGIDLTIGVLQSHGLAFTGTRSSDQSPWFVITEVKGFRLAWISCTKHLNGGKDFGKVLPCYEELGPDSETPHPELIEAVQDLAKEVDAVIVLPHFGKSYRLEPNKAQQKWAHRVLEQGALAIIGSHVHNLQPWEKYITRDGRETFVLYSLGNFVSGQVKTDRRLTIILYLSLIRTEEGTSIQGVRYLPLWMYRSGRNRYVIPLDLLPYSKSRYARKRLAEIFGQALMLNAKMPLEMTPQCFASPTTPTER